MADDKLDDVLEIAREVLQEYEDPMGGHVPTRIERLSRWLVDNLGEGSLCGWEAPTGEPGIVTITVDDEPEYVFEPPSEARAYAAMLIRASEAAEKR